MATSGGHAASTWYVLKVSWEHVNLDLQTQTTLVNLQASSTWMALSSIKFLKFSWRDDFIFIFLVGRDALITQRIEQIINAVFK